MSSNLVVKPEEYGLENKEGKKLTKNLDVIIDERNAYEEQYKRIIRQELNDETIEEARELRLKLVKVRTQGINKWHKNAKAYFKAGGDFVDAIRRKELETNQSMEGKLKEIEDYYENLAKEKKDKLRKERTAELQPFIKVEDDLAGIDLGEMADDIWEMFLKGKKQSFEKAQEEERLRIQKEKEEQERLQKENEWLRKEAEAKAKKDKERRTQLSGLWDFVEEDYSELSDDDFKNLVSKAKELKAEADKKTKVRAEREKELRPYIQFIKKYEDLINKPESKYKKELADIKKVAEDHWEYERKQQIKKQKEEEVREAKLKAEEEKRKKLEAELLAKKEAEEKALKEEEKRKQAGDSVKVGYLINDLEELKTKYSFKSAKNQKMYKDVNILLGKVINHIKK